MYLLYFNWFLQAFFNGDLIRVIMVIFIYGKWIENFTYRDRVEP
ncbi:hypothetical protein A4U88_2306 [Serratia marcescens]|nr:hypothetical protein A4U88_2306 [Serratia marcescens]